MTTNRRLREQILDLHEELTANCFDTAFVLYQLKEVTDELLLQATEIAEIAWEQAEDFRQASVGNVRIACQWCDGEFYVSRTKPGPYTCHLCRHCDGY
ncbi:hypothetical protein [Actinoplanes sp. NPDC049265]|uniref:hypothetical protein n=1 Tax=Actinoplanes sp. NPDC049265 TaxID=3363902 RepID=UPI0037103829